MRVRDALDHLHADRGVVAREALADVVEQGADEEEVGPLDPSGQAGGERGGLEQVPVDGEAVVGVALGLVAHGGPLGEEAHEESVLVQRLDLVDRGRAEGEQVDQGRGGSRRSRGRPAAGMRSARRWSEPLAMGRSSWAAVAARRRAQRGVVRDRRAGVSATSPSTSTMSGPSSARRPSATEPVAAGRRRKRRFGAGASGPRAAAAATRRRSPRRSGARRRRRPP